MSEFEQSWELSRKRLVDEIYGLSSNQLNWRLHPNALTIGEAILHVVGVEVSFSSQLLDLPLTQEDSKLKSAATDGVVNRNEFPYAPEEISLESLHSALVKGYEMVKPIMENPAPVAEKEMISALGPVINGMGALARLGFHSAYHQGQIYLIKTHPGFPSV